MVINNPVINLQTATLAAASTPSRATTPACSTTLIKVEVAWQYTKLTPEERAELTCTGSYFRCREQGHMAHQCPQGNHQIAVATVLEESTPTPTDSTPATDMTPASDF